MTRFSGVILLPSRTLQYLCEAANGHGLTVSRQAELCIIAASRIIDTIDERIIAMPPLSTRLAAQVSVNLSERVLQVIAARAHAEGLTINVYCRCILMLAVDGMAKAGMPVPKRSDPMPSFRTYKPSRIIVERDTRLGVPTFSMGDPPPGRSALDRKRAMEAAQ